MSHLSPVRLSLVVQLSLSIVASFFALLLGQVQAYSLFIGTIVFIVPSLYFTHYAFRFQGADLSEWIRRSFMWGQMGKLALAAVGFALTFRFVRPLDVAALFAGYSLMIFTQWWLGRKIAISAAADATPGTKDP